jgi:hypothetical protein
VDLFRSCGRGTAPKRRKGTAISCSSVAYCTRLIARSSAETVTRKRFGNIGLDRLCRTDVGLAACVFAFVELGETPPIERARKSRPERPASDPIHI